MKEKKLGRRGDNRKDRMESGEAWRGVRPGEEGTRKEGKEGEEGIEEKLDGKNEGKRFGEGQGERRSNMFF